MKKFILILITAIYAITTLLCVSALAAKDDDDEAKKEVKYSPHAENMLVCDVESGFKIYSKNSDKVINPYGLTKILTAITVIENTDDIDKKVTVPVDILKDYDYENKSIGLTSGESVAIKDLLCSMIMQDAGDSALTLAHTTCKSYDSFIELMNKTALKAGAKNSSFTEPAGFLNSNQKTTLEDMQKITSYALKNKDFCEIANTQRLVIEPTNLCDRQRIMFTRNQFLSGFYSNDYVNPNMSGVMYYSAGESDTGIIVRHTVGDSDVLILVAKSDITDDLNCAYEDVLYLTKKGNGALVKVKYIKKEEFVFEKKIKTAKDTEKVLIISLSDIMLKLPANYDSKRINRKITLRENIDAPLDKFEELGKIEVFYDDFKVGEAEVASYSKIEKSTLKAIRNYIFALMHTIYFWIAIMVIVAVRFAISKLKKTSSK